jgi:hypothetical protein
MLCYSRRNSSTSYRAWLLEVREAGINSQLQEGSPKALWGRHLAILQRQESSQPAFRIHPENYSLPLHFLILGIRHVLFIKKIKYPCAREAPEDGSA